MASASTVHQDTYRIERDAQLIISRYPKADGQDTIVEIFQAFTSNEAIRWINGLNNTVPDIVLRDKTLMELMNDYCTLSIPGVPYREILGSIWAYIREHEQPIKNHLTLSLARKMIKGNAKSPHIKIGYLLEIIA
jgi:hypothetical protein